MPHKIKIKYSQVVDFRNYPATGVFGGLINENLICLTFVADRPILPSREEVNVDEQGVPVGKPNYIKEDEDTILREAQTAISVNLATAKVILKWLQEKVELAESLAK